MLKTVQSPTGFGILDRRLDWQALGVELPEDTDVAFRPPRCGLLPNRYRRPLLAPVSQAHSALHKYSYQFRLTETLFESRAYRWVPWQAFTEFETVFNNACNNLSKAKHKVLDAYDEIRDEVIVTFSQVAADSARRLAATNATIPPDFDDRLINWVLNAFPTREVLQSRLTLRFQVGVLLLGSEMLREQRMAAEERQRIEQIEAGRRIEEARVNAEESAAQRRLWIEEESLRRRLEAEETDNRLETEVKERIRQMKFEAAREKLQETLSPLKEGAAQLRAQIYESAVAIQEALQKHDFLPGSTAKKARNMARWFRLMNFQSDEQLEQLLGNLEQLAAKPAEKVSGEQATQRSTMSWKISFSFATAMPTNWPSPIAWLRSKYNQYIFR